MVVLNDPVAMRGLLLTYTEKVLTLQSAVAAMAPKVEALDRISTSVGSFCITDAAKTIQVRPKDLFTYLQANRWIYKRPGATKYRGYEVKILSGLLEHKITTVPRSGGREKTVEQVRITTKGLTMLATLMDQTNLVA